jgi:hypothetical protein
MLSLSPLIRRIRPLFYHLQKIYLNRKLMSDFMSILCVGKCQISLKFTFSHQTRSLYLLQIQIIKCVCVIALTRSFFLVTIIKLLAAVISLISTLRQRIKGRSLRGHCTIISNIESLANLFYLK